MVVFVYKFNAYFEFQTKKRHDIFNFRAFIVIKHNFALKYDSSV